MHANALPSPLRTIVVAILLPILLGLGGCLHDKEAVRETAMELVDELFADSFEEVLVTHPLWRHEVKTLHLADAEFDGYLGWAGIELRFAATADDVATWLATLDGDHRFVAKQELVTLATERGMSPNFSGDAEPVLGKVLEISLPVEVRIDGDQVLVTFDLADLHFAR